ncbi:hypothetical protein E2C01_033376 [Portunus trituberculatus]|uniref:Uncharacterized protein n=1 Tax=Portunus trituberculatus TaxID=210409 RepID=A0A5B7F2S5_PORTR|nr:hypothetical protein [Portunus trituberculatus]
MTTSPSWESPSGGISFSLFVDRHLSEPFLLGSQSLVLLAGFSSYIEKNAAEQREEQGDVNLGRWERLLDDTMTRGFGRP